MVFFAWLLGHSFWCFQHRKVFLMSYLRLFCCYYWIDLLVVCSKLEYYWQVFHFVVITFHYQSDLNTPNLSDPNNWFRSVLFPKTKKSFIFLQVSLKVTIFSNLPKVFFSQRCTQILIHYLHFFANFYFLIKSY